MNSILHDIPMYHSLQNACLIEDKEISVINENYKRSMADEFNDDAMEHEGHGTGGGTSTTQEPTTGDAEASAEGAQVDLPLRTCTTRPSLHQTLRKSSKSLKIRERSSRPLTRSLPWQMTVTFA